MPDLGRDVHLLMQRLGTELTTFGAVAAQLVANGYLPVPIVPGWKHPPMAGWPTFRVDDAAIAEYRDHGCGLRCGELVGVDVDVLHEEASAELHRLARIELGSGPTRIGQPPKLLVPYRTKTPFRKKQTRAFVIDSHPAKVEVLARGQQFVSHAQHPVTKKAYRWMDGDPLDLPFTDLPEVSEAEIGAFLEKAEAVLARYGMPQKPARAIGEPSSLRPPSDDTPTRRAYAEAALGDEVRQVATAARGSRNDRLNTAALKLGQLVAAGWLESDRVERSLEDAACATGLASDDGVESVRATIRSGLEAGLREPRDPPAQQKRRNGARADKGGATRRSTSRPLLIGSDVEIAERVGEDLNHAWGNIIHAEGAFWRYGRTNWLTIPEHELRRAVHRYDGADFTTPAGQPACVKLGKSRVDSVLNELAAKVAQPSFFENVVVGINCVSGFIRFDGNGRAQLVAHDRDHRCRHTPQL